MNRMNRGAIYWRKTYTLDDVSCPASNCYEDCQKCETQCSDFMVIEKAIEALEKQMPKKPKRTDAYPHRNYCPKCFFTFFYNGDNAEKWVGELFNYCPECGQRVDWSDNE